MNDICYNLAIRQRKCQNSISIVTDNVYTNIEDSAILLLSFGYSITIVSKNSNSVTISLYNPDLLNEIKFNIPNGTYKTFDLPMYNGTYILQIGVERFDCSCPRIT